MPCNENMVLFVCIEQSCASELARDEISLNWWRLFLGDCR